MATFLELALDDIEHDLETGRLTPRQAIAAAAATALRVAIEIHEGKTPDEESS